MRVTTGRVVNGRIEIPDEEFAEGTVVTILTPDDHGFFTLGPEAEATLLASIGDVAHPAWRARSVGIYRLWRDTGFAVGALLSGVLADLYGISTAIWAVAALTAASGLVVAVRMYETLHRPEGIATGEDADG